MAARMTVKELDGRLDVLEGRIAELEEVIRVLHIDAASAAAKNTNEPRKQRKGCSWTDVQKRAFRVRMVEGHLESAREDGRDDDVVTLEAKVEVARARLEELQSKPMLDVEEPEEALDEAESEEQSRRPDNSGTS